MALKTLRLGRCFPFHVCVGQARWMTQGTKAVGAMGKREGDISDAFTSLSGKMAEPLPHRFRLLKQELAKGNEFPIINGWTRLLESLKKENETIAKRGPRVIPEVRFSHLEEDLAKYAHIIKKRGVVVIRGVIPEDEARAYKSEIEDYVKLNPQTKGFPAENPQVLELYWSAPQIKARGHPSLLKTQIALMKKLWYTSNPSSPISLGMPLCYADRLRIRQPGDAKFALGPHQDGGSTERWEKEGYGYGGGGVYSAVFRGEWEAYDPFDASARMHAFTDLYGGLGACSMFRMWQGWLSMSKTGPGEGTLQVNPLLKEATAYALLRPFFRPMWKPEQFRDPSKHLDPLNWEFLAGDNITSDLPGAVPGHGQEFPEGMHPHLELDKTMVNIPEVKPGDYVVWHCDTIHAVDRTHKGESDSSVLYIPVCPTTKANAHYVVSQRKAFLKGIPAPDFPGGVGESGHTRRPDLDFIMTTCDPIGIQAMGFAKIEASDEETSGGREAIQLANKKLGWE